MSNQEAGTLGLSIPDLELISARIRRTVLEVAGTDGGGHLGGTFSCIEILVNLFFGGTFKFGITNRMSKDRDRFILSKGHACLAYYSLLNELDQIPMERLRSFSINGGLGSQLDLTVPFVDWNTGSLGHSIGICAGIAMAARLDSRDYKAVSVIGDSELSEGSNWEAIAFCGDHALSNVIVIIDRNKLSVTSNIEDDSIYRDLELKMKAFGWNFLEIQGHSHVSLQKCFREASYSNRPTLILANTIKGKGVSFMENKSDWHHRRPSSDEYREALSELSKTIEDHKWS